MISLDVIHKLRQRLHATAAAKPNQWHTGVAMLRFLALMLLLTLLVRGTAATTLPVVTVTAPYQGVVTQSFTVSVKSPRNWNSADHPGRSFGRTDFRPTGRCR